MVSGYAVSLPFRHLLRSLLTLGSLPSPYPLHSLGEAAATRPGGREWGVGKERWCDKRTRIITGTLSPSPHSSPSHHLLFSCRRERHATGGGEEVGRRRIMWVNRPEDWQNLEWIHLPDLSSHNPFASHAHRSYPVPFATREANGTGTVWTVSERKVREDYRRPMIHCATLNLPLIRLTGCYPCRSSLSCHSIPREERRRSVTRGMGWEKEGAMSGWEKEPAHITLHAGSCHPLTPRSFTPSLTRCSLRSPLVTNGVSEERGT